MKELRINYLAVAAIVVLGQVIPAMWYTLMQEKWMILNNLTMEMGQKSGSTPYISSVIHSIFFGGVLAWLFVRLKIESAMDGLTTALIMSIPFTVLDSMTLNFFSIRPYELTWIDAAPELVMWAIAGILLGSWRKYKS